MKQRLISLLLRILSTSTGRYFLYIIRNANNAAGKTAIKDSSGVWHVGDVYSNEDIAYGIAQNGLVERHETELVHFILTRLRAQKEIVFHDIGANIGYYGLIAGTVFGAKVHSFEPTPEYAENIRAGALLNRIEHRTTIHQYALSNVQGDAVFHRSGSGSSLESDFNQIDGLPTIRVNTTTLDSEIEKSNVTPPTFIKLDVEGHEWAVLEGARQTIASHCPVIFLELCTTLREIGRSYVNQHYVQTLKLLTELNYTILLLTETGALRTWDKKQTIDRAGMFLCLHTDRHADLLRDVQNTYTIE